MASIKLLQDYRFLTMNYRPLQSTSTSGLAYFIHNWEPEGDSPVAQVLLLHGYAEHAMRYEPLARACVTASIRVVSPDHVGHGRSEGIRGYIPKMEIAIDDALKLLDEMLRQHPHIPTFVFGHSMGGAIATIIGARMNDRISGLILSGPSLIIANTPKFLQLLSPIPAALLPKVPFMPLKASDVSRNPEASSKYKDDPLNYVGKVRFGMGWQLIRAGKMALATASAIDRPIWVGHGERDGLTAPVGSERLLSLVRSTDKTYVPVPEARHEILNEPEGPGLITEIVDWMKQRM
jgi:acylglycerol lipase